MLDGKVALVSGTGPNIGSEIARTLADNGASVACLDLNEQYAQAAAISINEAGGHAIGVTADITQPESVQQAIQEIIGAFGGIHLLVNDAAISDRKPFLEAELSDWRNVLDVILTGDVHRFTAGRPPDGGTGRRRGDGQHHLNVRASWRDGPHRLWDRQVGTAQLHPLRGRAAGPPPDSSEFGDADNHRHSRGPARFAPRRQQPAPGHAVETVGTSIRPGSGDPVPAVAQCRFHNRRRFALRRRPPGSFLDRYRDCQARGSDASPSQVLRAADLVEARRKLRPTTAFNVLLFAGLISGEAKQCVGTSCWRLF